jgi:hypothetical protein
MNNSKFALFGAAALLVGTVSYFVVEGIFLHKKNKKAKSIETSINDLADAKTLVEGEDSETKEIVTESLNDELKKKEEISRNIEGSKTRIGIAIEVTTRIAPAILKFLAALALSPQREPIRREEESYHRRAS